jgi:hypothetical protein
MFIYPKCPKCEKDVSKCDLTRVIVSDPVTGPSFHGAAVSRPSCQTLLGITVDVAALAADIADQVARRM